MIQSLNDLVRYTEWLADTEPLIARWVRITRPGCAPDVIEALRQALPGLPESYLSIIASIAIVRVAVGYFQLTPSSPRGTALAEELRSRNDPVLTPMAKYYRLHGVYQVASWEADPICVAHSGRIFRIGQVVMYSDANLGDQSTGPPVVLADNFEQFLLIAANLQEIRAKREESPQALREFRAYLAPLVAGRRDDMESAWAKIAGVVLELEKGHP